MGLRSEIRILTICYPTPNPMLQLFQHHLHLPPPPLPHLHPSWTEHQSNNLRSTHLLLQKKTQAKEKATATRSSRSTELDQGFRPLPPVHAAPNGIRALHQSATKKAHSIPVLPTQSMPTNEEIQGGRGNPIRSDPIRSLPIHKSMACLRFPLGLKLFFFWGRWRS